MNETEARRVVLVRAVETTDVERTIWSDDDRAWASRAAAEVVGEHAQPDSFVARRAALALERLGKTHRGLVQALRAVTWRPWAGVLVVAAAFVLGVAVDRIGAPQRVNILAFPLLALLAWNLGVYLLVAVQGAWQVAGGRAHALGPVRRAVARIGRGAVDVIAGGGKDAPLAAPLAAFARDWAQRAAPLLAARVGTALHCAAAAFAAGAIAGLYARGLVLEYRAGWESTFLDADAVHGILAFVLGPAAALIGTPIPDAGHLAGIRFGALGAGENAGPWIHRYAVTVALLVLVPRGLLAAGLWLGARARTRQFPLPLTDAYFQRLLREFRADAIRARVLPYSYQVTPAALDVLAGIVRRVLGAKAVLDPVAPVAYGAEDDLPPDLVPPDAQPGLCAALFSLVATPEPENHGAFVAALGARLDRGTPFAVIVDESVFRARFPEQPVRIDERRAAWREMLAPQGIDPVFVDLAEPDSLAAEAALQAAMTRPLPRAVA